jgi:hypothetical protein
LVTRASHENPALGLVAAVGSRLARLLSTNHQARGAPAPAVIWLLLLAGERPKEEPLGRGRWGDKAGADKIGSSYGDPSRARHAGRHAAKPR